MDEKVEEMIRHAISAGKVSVLQQYDEPNTIYQIIADDGNVYELECNFMYGDKDVKFYEYAIFVNYEEFANQIISNRARAYTPMESSILKLFKLCSTKVIYQEMQAAVHNNVIKIDKQYMN